MWIIITDTDYRFIQVKCDNHETPPHHKVARGCEGWDDRMIPSYTRFVGLMNTCCLSRIHNALIALDKKRGNPTKKDGKNEVAS